MLNGSLSKKEKNTLSASILSFNHLSDYEFIRSEG